MRKLFTTTHRVARYTYTRYSRRSPAGSGYCEDQRDEQHLVREYRLFGRCYFRRVVDCEIIPDHVVIARAMFGEEYGWRSKFADIPNINWSAP